MNEQNSEMQLYKTTIHYALHITLWAHILWFLCFIWLDMYILAGVNFISAVFCTFAFLLVKKGYYALYFLMTILNIFIHATISAVYLSWDSGFHYYIFIIAFGVFLFPGARLIKGLAAIILIIYYALLYHFTQTGIQTMGEELTYMLHLINMVSVLCIIALLGYIFRSNIDQMIQNLHQMNGELERMAATDTLTGLFTRRKMYERIAEKMETEQNFCVMMIDIDYFKTINDQYGHAVGDAVIVHVSKVIAANLENKGFVSRWGGEEFLAAAEASGDKEAGMLADSIKQGMITPPLLHYNEAVSVTVSVGIAKWKKGRNIEEVINEADRALYSAKQKGRNCTTIHESVEI